MDELTKILVQRRGYPQTIAIVPSFVPTTTCPITRHD